MFQLEEGPGGAKKNLELISTEVVIMKTLWDYINSCEVKFEEYLNMEWKNIKALDMADDLKTIQKNINAIKKVDKKSKTFQGIMNKLKSWQTFLPMIHELMMPDMTAEDDRHWMKVKEHLGEDFEVEETMKLRLFWDFEIYTNKYRELLEEVTEQSKQESKIDKQLAEVEKKWKNVTFGRVILDLRDGPVEILKMNDEDAEKLEEDQLIIQTISGSKFVTYFAEKVNYWQASLNSINETITLLSEVQKTWSFLINLFLYSEEVKKELPGPSEDFVSIDQDVKKLLENSKQKENEVILTFCTQDYDGESVLQKLEQIFQDLNVCQKALNKFISDKRKVFPRFYFLTMEELLDILANGNNPTMLFAEKNYMNKIVQAADKLEMKDGGDRPIIQKMKSCVGIESLIFVGSDNELKLKGKVENYLQDVLTAIINAIQSKAITAHQEYKPINELIPKEGDPAPEEKVKFMDEKYSAINLLINAEFWVYEVESRFKKIQDGSNVEAMSEFLRVVICNLTSLIKLVQGKLSSSIRRKIMGLITMETHNRDIVDKLIKEKVRKADEFQWQSQLKFYFDEKENTYIIRIADASLKYGYEYLGNGARLVVTPLTDRIYVTATQALHLKMGCAPAGPAGTGKTETTKDLASAVGKACYVFNCSPEMDYVSMGNIFKGLASSGCWGCFDEFNRLVPEVLSVCTVQFKGVTDGIKSGKSFYKLDKEEVRLDPTCGAFITMNPGYLGRSELPEGLKALFRPITVVVPDLELI